jgi:hypothetical protein
VCLDNTTPTVTAAPPTATPAATATPPPGQILDEIGVTVYKCDLIPVDDPSTTENEANPAFNTRCEVGPVGMTHRLTRDEDGNDVVEVLQTNAVGRLLFTVPENATRYLSHPMPEPDDNPTWLAMPGYRPRIEDRTLNLDAGFCEPGASSGLIVTPLPSGGEQCTALWEIWTLRRANAGGVLWVRAERRDQGVLGQQA